MKVLITVPNLQLPGGVSNIYNSIKFDNTDDVEYFVNTSMNKRNRILFIPWMIFDFVRCVKQAKVVQLNPSLDAKAIIRDGFLILLSKMLNKKVIVFFHGWEDNFEKTIRENRLYRNSFSKVFNKADSFLLLGSVFKQKLHDLGVKDKQIYYLPTVAVRGEFQTSQFNNTSRITLLFLSRFVPLKGIEIVLRAFRCLQESHKRFDFDLIMAGDGQELSYAKKYVQQYDLQHVKFTGFVEGIEKHNCYAKSDILFFPSFSEGLPCVIMEAMLYGLAIVTRPVGGIPDWVKHNENGWISDSKEPSDFAKGILSLVANPATLQNIRETNQILARNKFTPDKFKRELQRIFQAMLYE